MPTRFAAVYKARFVFVDNVLLRERGVVRLFQCFYRSFVKSYGYALFLAVLGDRGRHFLHAFFSGFEFRVFEIRVRKKTRIEEKTDSARTERNRSLLFRGIKNASQERPFYGSILVRRG